MNKKRLFMIVVLGVALLFLVVFTARAQERAETTADRPVPHWVQSFGKQLKTLLESDNSLVRQQALQHITYFASFYGDDIDFSDAVPTLVDLYRHDDDADVRLHALVALYAIGDEKGMQQVRSALHTQQWPPRLQFITMSALVSYYGAETFSMDREAAVMAQNLMNHYLRPRVEIGPLEVVPPQMPAQQQQQQR